MSFIDCELLGHSNNLDADIRRTYPIFFVNYSNYYSPPSSPHKITNTRKNVCSRPICIFEPQVCYFNLFFVAISVCFVSDSFFYIEIYILCHIILEENILCNLRQFPSLVKNGFVYMPCRRPSGKVTESHCKNPPLLYRLQRGCR